MTVQLESWTGKTVGGRYRVKEKLGEGGMGTVYRARDSNLKLDVVVKVPKVELVDDPECRRRFQREVRALVKFHHPHVCKVQDVGEHDGIPFLVLQFLGGGSLEDLQPKAPNGQRLPSSPNTLASWLGPIAQALDFIHGKGFVHRDVKPANILFDENGHAYLSDFGIVKALGDEAKKTIKLTQAGMAIGTPEYMAPELIMGEAYDGGVDQYALAATVYEVLSGRTLFEGANPSAVFVMQTREEPRPLGQLLPALPQGLCQAVARGLSKRPQDRFPSCTAFVQSLNIQESALSSPAAGAAAASQSRATVETGPSAEAKESLEKARKLLANGFIFGLVSAGVLYLVLPMLGIYGLKLLLAMGAAFVAGYLGYSYRSLRVVRGLWKWMFETAATVKSEGQPPSPAGIDGALEGEKAAQPAAALPAPAAPVPESIKVACVPCKKSYAVPATAAGKRIRCLTCKQVLEVPTLPDAVPPAKGTAHIQQGQVGTQVMPRVAKTLMAERRKKIAVAVAAALVIGGIPLVWIAFKGDRAGKDTDPEAPSAKIEVSSSNRSTTRKKSDAPPPSSARTSSYRLRPIPSVTLLSPGDEATVKLSLSGGPASDASPPVRRIEILKYASGILDQEILLESREIKLRRTDREPDRRDHEVEVAVYLENVAEPLVGTFRVLTPAARSSGSTLLTTSNPAIPASKPDSTKSIRLKLGGPKEIILYERTKDQMVDLTLLTRENFDKPLQVTLQNGPPEVEVQAASFSSRTNKATLRLSAGAFVKETTHRVKLGPVDSSVGLAPIECDLILRKLEIGRFDHDAAVTAVAFSADGRLAAAGCGNGSLHVWDLTDKSRRWSVDQPGGSRISCLIFGPDSSVICGDLAGRLTLYSDSGKKLQQVEAHAEGIMQFLSSEGSTFESIGKGKEPRVRDPKLRTVGFWRKKWSFSSLKEMEAARPLTPEQARGSYGHDKRHALNLTSRSVFALYSGSSQVVRSFRGHTGDVLQAEFSPDDAWILSAGDDGSVRLWETNSGRMARLYQGHAGSVNSIAFSKDGKYGLSGGNDRSMRLWRVVPDVSSPGRF